MTEEEGQGSQACCTITGRWNTAVRRLQTAVEHPSVGKMAGIGREVFVRLLEKGIQARYQDVNIVKPIKTTIEAMNTLRGSLIVTIEDNIVTGGFGESLQCALQTGQKVLRFGWPDRFIEQGTLQS